MNESIRERLETALAKPLPESDDVIHDGVFNPWSDVLSGIHGDYSSECDALMIEALRAVRDRKTFDFIDRTGLAGEFALYVLSGHGLTEYGTSPRGAWPDPEVDGVWAALISKWLDFYEVEWGEPFDPVATKEADK